MATTEMPRAAVASLDLEECALLTKPTDVAPPRGTNRVAVLLALAGMVWATVAQSEASQALQKRGQFNKPFFILCFNHTLTGVLVPLTLVYFRLFGCKKDRYESSWWRPLEILHRHSVLPADQLLPLAWFFSFFFLFVDYFWYAALTGVSVTAATAIGNSTPLFVYCFSICLLHERVTCAKVSGMLCAFVGVSLVVLYQDADLTDWRDQSVVAGLLVVVSSAFYGAYDVALKYMLGSDLTDTATVIIVTGLSGLFTVPMWILGSVLVAHSPIASLQESFEWPPTSQGIGLLFLSGSLAVLINVCTPLLVCWTSPLETSVGGMLVVPLSGAWDVVFHGTHFSSQCVAGSVLVLVGFGALEYASQHAEVSATTPARGGAHRPKHAR